MRLSGPRFIILLGLLGLGIVLATDQIVPATSAYQAQMRIWLAARAAGIVAYLLLTGQIVFGLILSHPTNQATWKLSKRLFPWHENLWIFVLAFLGAHIVSIILDPYAGVGMAGTFIPGLSSYRSSPVALGTLAMYALILTGVTARYTKLLPQGSGSSSTASASSCSSSPGSTGSCRGRTPTRSARCTYGPVCGARGGGLPLLGGPEGPAHVLDLAAGRAARRTTAQGGGHAMISHPAMTTRLLLRRIAVIAAVVAQPRPCRPRRPSRGGLDRGLSATRCAAGLGQDPRPSSSATSRPARPRSRPSSRADEPVDRADRRPPDGPRSGDARRQTAKDLQAQLAAAQKKLAAMQRAARMARAARAAAAATHQAAPKPASARLDRGVRSGRW